jgi:hypothetical protein
MGPRCASSVAPPPASAARVDWDDDDRDATARFAARVEGSPLALVLAAGWLQLGPPTSVLEIPSR